MSGVKLEIIPFYLFLDRILVLPYLNSITESLPRLRSQFSIEVLCLSPVVTSVLHILSCCAACFRLSDMLIVVIYQCPSACSCFPFSP